MKPQLQLKQWPSASGEEREEGGRGGGREGRGGEDREGKEGGGGEDRGGREGGSMKKVPSASLHQSITTPSAIRDQR